ncbi:MAG: SLC13 family permease [Parvularculaceae bacterium]|nr:SLC13 family permease [Parvularculaceae bacterium]
MIFGLDAFAPAVAALIILVLFVSFAREWRAPEVSALAAVAVFLVLGILTPADVVKSLSNSAPVTIGAMFIITASLLRTGVLEALAGRMRRIAETRPRLAVVSFLSVLAAISGFVNNTPLVMLMVPITVALAEKLKESPSKLLIPLSYAVVLGGMTTLVGTSTNILVDGVARHYDLPPFHIMEVAPLGVCVAAAGVLLVVLGRRLLPDRTTLAALVGGKQTQRFIVEIVIEGDSPYIGQHPLDVKAFNEGDRRVVDVIRGDASLRREFADVILQAGDIIVMRSAMAEILTMKEEGAMKTPDSPRTQGLQPLSSRKSVLVEVLLAPGAHFVGRTLRHLRLRRRYGVYPIALHRRSENLGDRFEQTPLEVGDTILIEGAPEDLKRLVDDNDLVNVAEPEVHPIRRRHAPIAIAVIFCVVMGSVFEIMPIEGLAVIGAAVVLATRCIEADEAFTSIDWRILTLILAMLAIGTAIDKTGLVDLVAGSAAPHLMQVPPIVALAAVYVFSLVLTEFLTNNAVAIVVTPVAIELARQLGVDPRPFVVAVMFSASLAFATPIGYQTNTLVYSVGGYKFTDFLKLGVPLNILTAVMAILLIPVFWPLN